MPTVDIEVSRKFLIQSQCRINLNWRLKNITVYICIQPLVLSFCKTGLYWMVSKACHSINQTKVFKMEDLSSEMFESLSEEEAAMIVGGGETVRTYERREGGKLEYIGQDIIV